MSDFVEWLESDRWKAEVWSHLHMMFTYHRGGRVLVSCDCRGVHLDFIALSGNDSVFRGHVVE